MQRDYTVAELAQAVEKARSLYEASYDRRVGRYQMPALTAARLALGSGDHALVALTYMGVLSGELADYLQEYLDIRT